ncbi:MAG: MOSC domain-containing protein [Pseudomonadales bacterium]|nr:MOSC domain-containing protein [Pseudomonadales bacterium]
MTAMMSRFASGGTLTWIGVRTERGGAVNSLRKAVIVTSGLAEDYRENPGKRAVSLIQHEHLAVIAALACRGDLSPEMLRRNLVVSGINLLALRKSSFRIGAAVLQGTGLCAPCSKMEAALGEGGFTAMRGHGGITASVLEEGTIEIGDPVIPLHAT